MNNLIFFVGDPMFFLCFTSNRVWALFICELKDNLTASCFWKYKNMQTFWMDFLIYFNYKSCNFYASQLKNDIGYHPLSFHNLTYHFVSNFDIKGGKYSNMGIF